MSAPRPWSREKRLHMQDRIAKQAERSAKALKAKCCLVVAFFDDGEYLHILEGGQTPMPLDEVYRGRLAAREMLQDATR